MSENVLKSSARSNQDLAGVFERDDKTSYFYLYEIDKEVLGAIDVTAQCQRAAPSDIEVKWNSADSRVGLFLNDKLIAMYEAKVATNGAFEAWPHDSVTSQTSFN